MCVKLYILLLKYCSVHGVWAVDVVRHKPDTLQTKALLYSSIGAVFHLALWWTPACAILFVHVLSYYFTNVFVVNAGEWVCLTHCTRTFQAVLHAVCCSTVLKSDCYVQAYLPTASRQPQRTHTVPNSRDPVWDHVFR